MSSEEFAMRLVEEERLAVAPEQPLENREGTLRISCMPPIEDLKTALIVSKLISLLVKTK